MIALLHGIAVTKASNTEGIKNPPIFWRAYVKVSVPYFFGLGTC